MELYGFDSDGKKIPKLERGSRVIPVRETRSYYDGVGAGGEDEAAFEDGEAHARFDSLTDEERRCLQLHEARGSELDALVDPSLLAKLISMPRGGPRVREEKQMVPKREEAALVAAGWHLVKREGRVSHLVKNFPLMLGRDQIARITGLTSKQVRSRLLSAYRKLRGPVRSSACEPV